MKYNAVHKESDIKSMAKNIISIAKKKNKIKPLEDAFKNVPTNRENHKGKLSYYS